MEKQLRKSNMVKNAVIAGLLTIIYHANILETIPQVTKAIGVTMFFMACMLMLMYFDGLFEYLELKRNEKRRRGKVEKWQQ